jgi:hypothetical protein
MEEIIAAELFRQAVEAKVWLTLSPADPDLQKFAQDSEKSFDDYLNDHPHLRELAKAWYNSKEGK